MLTLLIIALVQTATCLATTYSPAPVPGDIALIYPTANISTRSIVNLGIGGGALSVPHDYYGLEYKFNITYTDPDGTSAFDVGDYRDSGALCHGRPANEIPPGKFNGVKFVTDKPGTYTAFWAITYSTGTNATVNETHCDLPTAQESSQMWIYNVSFTAVDSAPGTSPSTTGSPPSTSLLSVAHTTTTIALDPKPTGTFFEKNGAGSAAPTLGLFGLFALLLAWMAI